MKKIYIIGPVGSGKTTFSKKLSNKYGINRYELDKVLWDDDNGNIKRTDEEVLRLFNEILNNDSWIIEDVGRDRFKKGREQADIIYYIKFFRLKAYYRVIKRWLKQRLGLESYNHPPTFSELLYFISIVNSYYKTEQSKIRELEEFHGKVIFLNSKNIKKLIS